MNAATACTCITLRTDKITVLIDFRISRTDFFIVIRIADKEIMFTSKQAVVTCQIQLKAPLHIVFGIVQRHEVVTAVVCAAKIVC